MPLKKQPRQKRPSLLDNPPTASSSSESEEEHQTPSLLKKKPVDEEENASSEEASSEEEGPVFKSPVAHANSNPKPSESESESDSGSDSDQAPPPPSPNPKSKPKPKSQILASPSATPSKSAAKRPAEENGDTRAKKNKGAVVVGSDEEKSKKPFQKVWSDEDEITIVKGLANFILRTGNDPMKYPEGFYDSVKKSLLRVDTNPLQVKEKVRRLKMKFQAHAGKGKNGEDPSFTKPHDQNLFELSKIVWGKREANGAEQNPTSDTKKSEPETIPELEPETIPELESDMQVVTADSSLLLREMSRVSGLSEDLVKTGVELIGASKREELEGKLKKIQVKELELFAERADLIQEQSRLILEAVKASNNN